MLLRTCTGSSVCSRFSHVKFTGAHLNDDGPKLNWKARDILDPRSWTRAGVSTFLTLAKDPREFHHGLLGEAHHH